MRTLTDEARRHIAVFDDITDATATDCLLDGDDRAVFLVAAGEMGQAIGPGGKRVKRLEDCLGRDVRLVEDADTPEALVASALAPAVVHNVTISEGETTVAYAEVAEADTGVAIGADGETINTARRLAKRRFDIDGIELV